MLLLPAMLLQFILIQAMVIVPEKKLLRTAFVDKNPLAGSQRLLFLEKSPLIGGPPWFLAHIKVVLHDVASSVEHRWDFLPRNATDLATLQRLLTLQRVPAETRYQSSPISSAAKKIISIEPEMFSLPTAGFDIVMTNLEIDQISMQNGSDCFSNGSALHPTEGTKQIVEKANAFCNSYPEELHLIQNNCWRFAFELYEHLSHAS